MRLMGVSARSVFLLALLMMSAIIFYSAVVCATDTPPAAQSGSAFRFVVIGDMHIGDEGQGVTEVHRQAIRKIIDDIRPAFVVQTGDLIDLSSASDRSSQAVLDAMYANVQREVASPLSSAGIMFFSSPGNHDRGSMHSSFWAGQAARNNNYAIEGDYGSYLSFDYGNSHFVLLLAPGTPDLSDKAVQLAWLRQDLERARSSGKSNIFTFAHSPLMSPAIIRPWNVPETPLLQRSGIAPLLRESGVDIHFSGHIHVVKEQEVEGVRDIIAGMLGGHRATPADPGVPAPWTFLVVDVAGDDVQYYKAEAPNFDTSSIPSAPEVSAPITTPSLPASVANIGSCPPGTRAVQQSSAVPPSQPASNLPTQVTESGSAEVDEADSESAVPPSQTVSTQGAPLQQSAGTCGAKVAAVGDSITAGSSYVVKLRQLCGGSTEIKNSDDDPLTNQSNRGMDKFAFVGKHTAQMKDDIGSVLSWTPDTVMMLGGTNDLGMNPDAVKSNLLAAYNDIKGSRARLVVLTVPPIKDSASRPAGFLEHLQEINRWILSDECPADVKVNIYDDLVVPGTDDANPELFAADLTHPNQRGKEIIAAQIHAALIGAAPPSVPSAPPGQAAVPAVGASTGTVCVPESVLPQTIYDFIMNSSAGITTIIGIARQNIAVNIDKTPRSVSAGALCQPLAADRSYDLAVLKETYGQSHLDVESQLETLQFMGTDVTIHRLILPALGCVEQQIRVCDEADDYDFSDIRSYSLQAPAEDPELLATSSFGISLDINPGSNPNAQDGSLTTDLPQCVIDAFKRFGFRWGGDNEGPKSPSHFEFMADPARIVVQEGIVCPAGSELVTVPSDSAEVSTARVVDGVPQSSSSTPSSLIGNSDFIWPIPDSARNWNSVGSCFGWRNIGSGPRYHDGIDISVGTGTPVVAIDGGQVQRVCSIPSQCLTCNIPQCTKLREGRCSGNACGSCTTEKCAVCGEHSSQCGGFGNTVLIKHADNLYSHYNHLNTIDPAMRQGATVTKGQQVGTVGNTGVSQGAHLHFAFYNDPGARDTGNAERPENGQNPFCFFSDAVMSRLEIQSRNNCVNYGSPPTVSSTHPRLIEDCSYADLSALAGLTPEPSSEGATQPVPGGPALVQVCRPTTAPGAQAVPQPLGGGTVAADQMQCHYCSEAKRYVGMLYPSLGQACLAATTPCCTAPCPPGSVVKPNVPYIRQADESAMGPGGDCWHDGVSPDRPEGSTAGESYRAAGCGVASMRMALGGYSIDVSSKDLFCGSPQGSHTIFLVEGGGSTGGSSRPLMVDAAQELGRADATQSGTIDWDSIVSNIRQGKIVVFHLGDRDKVGSNGIVQERCYVSVGHYIVLLGANDDYVIANDPGGHCSGGEERIVLSKAYIEGVGKGYVVV